MTDARTAAPPDPTPVSAAAADATGADATVAADLAAVLFDLDGTLVDTEPYWFAAEYRLVAEFGGTWSDEHAHALVGSDLLDSARYIADVGKVPLTPEQIVSRMVADVVGACRRSVPWRPGAVQLLAACREAGLPTALVTMSYRQLTDAVLAQLPANTFSTVVTGDEVTRGKPHPDPYLQACALLAVSPRASVAIEDSPPGVASALAAGCAVVAVPNAVSIPAATGVQIVESMSQLTVAQLRGISAQQQATAAARSAAS